MYCYEDVSGGITTHIAGNRVIGDIPEVPFLLDVDSKTWLKAHRKQMRFLDKAKREPIGLPYDNETFNDPDYESFLKRLLHLREVGYNFSDYVIEAVKEDMKSQLRTM